MEKGWLRGEERLAEGEACVGACIEKASHVEGTIDNLEPPTVLITRLNISTACHLHACTRGLLQHSVQTSRLKNSNYTRRALLSFVVKYVHNLRNIGLNIFENSGASLNFKL